jgi:hypothetical protein
MDNEYVDGLRQYDSRARSPVVVPHNISALRKKILFENNLLEERALHEFSAGKGDGAGVDTGSAPLKSLTSLTPTPTRTPTPTPTPVPLGTPVTITLNAANGSDPASPFNGRYTRVAPGTDVFYGGYQIAGTGYAYQFQIANSRGYIILGPGTSYIIYGSGEIYPATGFWTLIYVWPDDGINAELVSANISTDANNVPRTGWDAGLVPPVSITTP